MLLNQLKQFKLFKDMPVSDIKRSHLHNQAFFKNRVYPRFFQSNLYLKSERKYFYYGFIDNCFIIVKKYIQFKNYICYLVVPPISLSGDLKKELDLINKFNNLGIKTRVSEEDIKLYNLNKSQYKKNKDDIEMIYSPEYYKGFSGKKLANFRYAENLKDKLINECKINCSINNVIIPSSLAKNEILLENWSKEKRKAGITSKGDACHKWFKDINFGKYYEMRKHNENPKDDQILISSIIEEILPNKIILDTNYSDYTIQIPGFESVKAMHVLLMRSIHQDSMVNSGSGGFDKGLTAHKRYLKPCKELQIYDTVPTIKITEETYNYVCKGDL